MALRDEDMDKRREKREAMRRKQRSAARRMRLTLLVALVILGLCGYGIWQLTQNGEDVQAAAPTQATQPPTEATEPTQRSPLTTIHLRAAGDLNVTDSVVSSGIAVNGYDFSGVFKDVSSVLSGADLTFMNFEGNACGEPYGSETSSAPVRLLDDLRACGVDLLQVANSCAINNGINGLTATLNSIRSAGIEPLGAYASSREYQASKGYTIVEVKGVKIAFVAFTKGLGGRGMPAGSENLVNLLYVDYDNLYQEIDKDTIETVLKNVQAERPDLTVALLHWGSEYNDDISKTQKSIANLMLKRGVDVIIGTHPHTLQPIVFDQAAGTLVAYSLGDFFGDAVRGATNYSIVLDIEVTKDTTTGKTRVTDYSYIPIYTVTESECPDQKRRVVRIQGAMKGYGLYDPTGENTSYPGRYLDSITLQCYESMKFALQRIEERIVMPEEKSS